jgi:HSP20 family molecular chaperone IbpA
MADDDGGEMLYREFGPVRYQRTFELSDDIDREKIAAVVKNGVLRLVMQKKPESCAQRRQIAVMSG